MFLFLLCALVFDATVIGWYSQHPTQSPYVMASLVVLALVLALLAYRVLVRTVLRPLKNVGAYVDQMAAGDLTQRIEVTTESGFGVLLIGLKHLQDSLGRTVGTVRAGMEHINRGSQHIVSGNTDLGGRTDQQVVALQQTAASLEELASTVKQNADNARQANQLATTASEVAQRGGSAVGEVVATMHDISASSRKISDIVGVIDSIAFQTNILALNAAVEAARAGDQGKGFAVVATEVRALAQRSAQAAREIKDLIDDSVTKVAEGSGQVERAGATMQEIVVSVARVTDIMGEISAATTEQSLGIDQINLAVAQMDQVTQQNASLVEQAALAAASLREHATQVTEAVSPFKIIASQVIVSATQIPASRKMPPQSSPPQVPVQPPQVSAQPPSAPVQPRAASRDTGKQPIKLPPVRAAASTRAVPPKQNGDAAYSPKLSPLNPNAQTSEDEWVEF